MFFSKTNMRKPSAVSTDPLAAAASLTDDHNISEVARLLGKSPKTLLAKLNNDSDFHQLHLGEAVAITHVTQDARILSAWAVSMGKVLIDVPKPGITDDEFSDLLLLVQERTGELGKTIRQARADGIITDAEYADIRKATISVVELLFQVDSTIQQQVRE